MYALLFSSMFTVLLMAVMVFDAATADTRKANRKNRMHSASQYTGELQTVSPEPSGGQA